MPRVDEAGTENLKTLIDTRFQYVRGSLNGELDPEKCPFESVYEMIDPKDENP